MKKATAVICLAMVMVLGIASVAFADTTSGYLTPSGSPHGAYTTASKKCGVCHAVHKATASGDVLMRGTVADACVYCHITSTTGVIAVYNATASNYNGADLKTAHNSVGGANCVDCHTPHGALALIADNAYLEEKILKEGSAGAEETPLVGDTSAVAVAKWCTNCHNSTSNTNATPYYETAFDIGAGEGSHVMKAASLDYDAAGGAGSYAGQVAWTDSTTCRHCHADGAINQSDGTVKTVASSYPHFTVGERFLTDANGSAADSEADGVCLRCHVNGTDGAGLTY